MSEKLFNFKTYGGPDKALKAIDKFRKKLGSRYNFNVREHEGVRLVVDYHLKPILGGPRNRVIYK